MNKQLVGYWASTGLIALAFATGGAMDLAGPPPVIEGLRSLGYPAYLAALLGVWKLLGTVAIVVPGFARLKEWAYAGIFFNLTGAAVSHAAVGDSLDKIVTPLVLLMVMFVSWRLRPLSRTLVAGPAPAVRATERTAGGGVVAVR